MAQSGTVLTVIIVGALLAGCARLDPPPQRTGEDPYDVIHLASYETADPASQRTRDLPSSAHHRRWFPWFHTTPPRRSFHPVDKVHPRLRQWIATRPGTDREVLFVTYVDTTTIPRFPTLDYRGARNDPALPATADPLMTRARSMADSIAASRAPQVTADTLDLVQNFDATVLRTFWLVRAVLVEMPLNKVDALAQRSDVVFIRPNAGNPPPQPPPGPDPLTNNDVAEARDQIGTDHYRELGLGFTWTALLDTGAETAHSLLCGGSPPSTPFCMIQDCVTGAGLTLGVCSLFTSCYTAASGDVAQGGHGTSTAAILAGNQSMGPRFLGVTPASLDLFKVYDSNNVPGMDAVLTAIELAVTRLNRVIVAELQEETWGDVVAAADAAFEAGVAVIAANGNFPSHASMDPAQGRRVIGVGAYDVRDSREVDRYSGGTTYDGRMKPELLAPTYTETARAGAPSQLGVFGGTSGATPYAAGAAIMLSDWMRSGAKPSQDPGQVYAHLILSGDRVGPFGGTSKYGAGRLKLPTTGSSRWGKTWVSDGVPSVDIPIEINENFTHLEAAIWWPEETIIENGVPLDTHNDIDLEIVSPGPLGTVKATSSGSPGVFERAAVTETAALAHGNWLLRIKGYAITSGSQTVYWGASLRK